MKKEETELSIMLLNEFIVGQQQELKAAKNFKSTNLNSQGIQQTAINNIQKGITEASKVIKFLELSSLNKNTSTAEELLKEKHMWMSNGITAIRCAELMEEYALSYTKETTDKNLKEGMFKASAIVALKSLNRHPKETSEERCDLNPDYQRYLREQGETNCSQCEMPLIEHPEEEASEATLYNHCPSCYGDNVGFTDNSKTILTCNSCTATWPTPVPKPLDTTQ